MLQQLKILAIIASMAFTVAALAEKPMPPECPSNDNAAYKPKAFANNYKSLPEALAGWKSPDDLASWLAAYTSYDMPRAEEMGQTLTEYLSGNRKPDPKPYGTQEFFDKKSGMCLDVSRFAALALKKIDPSLNSKSLMIEFEPCFLKASGIVMEKHWLTSFEKDGQFYFMGDTRFPGLIRGPFKSVDDFVDFYADVRSRTAVRFLQFNIDSKPKAPDVAPATPPTPVATGVTSLR